MKLSILFNVHDHTIDRVLNDLNTSIALPVGIDGEEAIEEERQRWDGTYLEGVLVALVLA